jgi:hypothetical protein
MIGFVELTHDQLLAREWDGQLRRRAMGRICAFASMATALFGLMGSVPAEPRRGQRLSTAERKTCIAKRGRVQVFGLSGNEGCVLPMPDAGRPCTDGSQCKGGTCTLDERRPGFKPPSGKGRTVGICASTNFGFGCGWRISKGKASAMCVIERG